MTCRRLSKCLESPSVQRTEANSGPTPWTPSNIGRRGRRFGLLCVEQRVPLGLHSLDLLEKQFEPIEFSTNLGFEMLGQATAIAGLERTQPRGLIATQRLIAGCAP